MHPFRKYFNLSFPILITGPTGSGKSTLARELFEKSQIFKTNFIEVNLASIKDDLIESELFGHKKGSFTGAFENKLGFFESAQNGTIFIDEIGELNLASQKKILHILDENYFYQMGSTEKKIFKGRMIFATNKNLLDLVLKGEFREDLYYRLNAFEIELSPIAKSRENLKSVILNMFSKLNSESKKSFELDVETLKMMLNYSWPGNIRELKNVINFLLSMSENQIIKPENLPKQFLNSSTNNIDDILIHEKFESALQAFEARFIKYHLEKNQGKINQTSRKIGLNKVTFLSKVKKYNLKAEARHGLELVKSIA